MRVLMLSTDQKILEEGSGARARMLEYASSFGNLNILLISKKFRVSSFEFRINDKLTIQTISFWRALFTNCSRFNLEQLDVDVVTAQDPFEIGFIAWRIAKKLGVRLQLQIHTDFLSPYFTKYSVLNWVRVKIGKFLLPKADGIRVVSSRIKQSLIHDSRFMIHEEKITILPVFIDVEKFQAPRSLLKETPPKAKAGRGESLVSTDLHKKYPQFEKIILMVSRITKEKNIELAIDAMREVVKQDQKVGLVIVGEGPELSALKLKTKNYTKADVTVGSPTGASGLETNVIFEPWTNDVASYYKTTDLFLNTSWYEGYGRTLLEAAVCGLPIVSADVGIIREVGGVIVGWNSTDIALRIMQALKNPQKPISPSLPSKQEYLQTYARILTQ